MARPHVWGDFITLTDLAPGESLDVVGELRTYTVQRSPDGSWYKCDCFCWENSQYAENGRTCKHLILTLGRQFERARLRDYAAADNKPTAPGFVNKLLWKMYYREQQQEKVKAWEKDMAEWEEKVVAHQKRKDEKEARRVERERVKEEKRRAKGKGREERRENDENGDEGATDARQPQKPEGPDPDAELNFDDDDQQFDALIDPQAPRNASLPPPSPPAASAAAPAPQTEADAAQPSSPTFSHEEQVPQAQTLSAPAPSRALAPALFGRSSSPLTQLESAYLVKPAAQPELDAPTLDSPPEQIDADLSRIQPAAEEDRSMDIVNNAPAEADPWSAASSKRPPIKKRARIIESDSEEEPEDKELQQIKKLQAKLLEDSAKEKTRPRANPKPVAKPKTIATAKEVQEEKTSTVPKKKQKLGDRPAPIIPSPPVAGPSRSTQQPSNPTPISSSTPARPSSKNNSKKAAVSKSTQKEKKKTKKRVSFSPSAPNARPSAPSPSASSSKPKPKPSSSKLQKVKKPSAALKPNPFSVAAGTATAVTSNAVASSSTSKANATKPTGPKAQPRLSDKIRKLQDEEEAAEREEGRWRAKASFIGVLRDGEDGLEGEFVRDMDGDGFFICITAEGQEFHLSGLNSSVLRHPPADFSVVHYFFTEYDEDRVPTDAVFSKFAKDGEVAQDADLPEFEIDEEGTGDEEQDVSEEE